MQKENNDKNLGNAQHVSPQAEAKDDNYHINLDHAKKMLAMGLEDTLIKTVTDLPQKEIDALK